MHRFDRKLEQFYTVIPFVAEFWNTLSNLPLILIGLFRLYTHTYGAKVKFLYEMMVLAGVCSGIHHALPMRGSIILDWIPIAITLYTWIEYQVYSYITLVTWFKISLALMVLLTDHVWTPIKVPWGHVFWHILASFALDSVYQDFSDN